MTGSSAVEPESEATRAETSTRAVLANAVFSRYLFTFFLSNIGTFMQALGVPFLLFRLTRSSTWVGAGTVAGQGMAVLASPLSGVLSDRVGPKRVLIVSQLVQIVASVSLWMLSLQSGLTPWRILGCLMVGGFGSGLQFASAQALLPELVSPRQIGPGVRLMSLTFNVPRSFGPALAGLVLASKGPAFTFGINTLSFIPFVAVLLTLRVTNERSPGSEEPWSEQILGGVRELWSKPAVRNASLYAFLLSLLGVAIFLHTSDLGVGVYHTDAAGVGWLQAVYGLGAAIGSLWLIYDNGRTRALGVGIGGLVAHGVGGLLILLPSHLNLVAFAGFAIMGAGNAFGYVALGTVVQTECDPIYRGRVTAANLMFLLVGSPIGSFACGALADATGIRWSFLAFAGALTVSSLVIAVRFYRPSGGARARRLPVVSMAQP